MIAVTAVGRLQGRLRALAGAEAPELGPRALVDADAAARLASRADGELARAGVGAADRAEILVAAAELRDLVERASWRELRARSAAIELTLRQVPGQAPRRRMRRLLAAFSAAAVPWPMGPGALRPRR